VLHVIALRLPPSPCCPQGRPCCPSVPHYSLQVYNGSRAWWCESDPPGPINAYGRSKLEAEQLLQQSWPGNFVALRSSLIYGPQPPLAPVDRPLFLQFVQHVLQAGKQTTFFVDEYR
jgi:dTDP-4-dehydrorhamnose reductase